MSFKNTPPSVVSTKLTFPCTECNFEAQSARQLSRHKAVTHTQNALKCVLCPFVTAYQTNLLRHRKDVHGICGSKGNKSCKFCGFVSEDNDTLIQHQIEYHQDILKSAQAKFAKELVSAGGEESIADFSANFESMSEDLLKNHSNNNNNNHTINNNNNININNNNIINNNNNSSLSLMNQSNNQKKKSNSGKSVSQKVHHFRSDVNNTVINKFDNVNDEKNEFEDFWKASFMEQQYDDHNNYFGQANSILNLSSDALQNADSLNTSSRSSTPKSQSSNINMPLNKNDAKNLPATRIRRQYNCNDCGFRTVNPREFLYHRRDIHRYKVKIVECPYCVYACQYVQKLQRHLLLVHKMNSVMNPTSDGLITNNNEITGQIVLKRKYKKSQTKTNSNNLENLDEDSNNMAASNCNDDQSSVNETDFCQGNNFEMNINEFSNENDDDEIESSTNTISDDKKYFFNLECFICKIKFADTISAQKHFLKHHKQHSNFKSQVPMIKNDTNQWLAQQDTSSSNQKKVFDSSNKNIHVCIFCGYKTRWISELERHIRVHSKEKPFKCPICDFRSKWKGDLNRHVQRYHSNDPSLPDFESDNSTNGGVMNPNEISPNEGNDDETMNDSIMNEDYAMSTIGDMEDTIDDHQSNDNEIEMFDLDNEDNLPAYNGSMAKMYKCTYCDFMCSTASRFHVHYVQHLNTKPFQCSVCGHRSNWEWDVTKHIKMKAQRDPKHEKARPVLIHDSGKRDYSKYTRFVVWVGQEEAELANNENSKIDFRAKRFRGENEDGDDDGGRYFMDSFLQPEVCFEVDGEANVLNKQSLNSSRKSIIKSVIVSRHSNSGSKIKCPECQFEHHLARVMVAHMSSHNQTKPYSCKHCSFESNWREVVINHLNLMHKDANPNDFEMRFRCVIDETSVCRIISLDEVARIEANEPSVEVNPVVDSNSSLIRPNIYEEKAVIRCELCPFITTNHKKMSIHCRFHNQSKGSIKCKYCPYYVNNREKLIRHEKLHQKIDLIPNNRTDNHYIVDNNVTNETNITNFQQSNHQTNNRNKLQNFSLISCMLCPYQANSKQKFDHHMNTHHPHPHQNNNHQNHSHHQKNINNDNEFGYADINDNIMEQTLTENDYGSNGFDPNDLNNVHQASSSSDIPYNATTIAATSAAAPVAVDSNSVSLIDVNNIKDGHAKKFSYVCPDCPAAFKNPGDYKIHAVFHSSNLEHACPYCTYKARNKPQLCKHLYVHTVEYISKRANSYPDGTKHLIENRESGQSNISLEIQSPKKNFKQKVMKNKSSRKHRSKFTFLMKPVKVKLNSEENGKQNIVFNNTVLMASQEFLETKEYLQRINSGVKNRCMYRCSKCPAVFTKVNTLIYHMTLHDQNARFTCNACMYSTDSQDNLNIHSLLHNLTESQTALGYKFNYNCHKCPAGFSKRSRLEKHLELHGARYNWRCDKCDYSVRYAATLVKHRALHLINPDFQAMDYNNEDLMNSDSYNNSVLQNESNDDENEYLKNDLKLKLNLSTLPANMQGRNSFDIPLDSMVNDDDDDDDDEDVEADADPDAGNIEDQRMGVNSIPVEDDDEDEDDDDGVVDDDDDDVVDDENESFDSNVNPAHLLSVEGDD